MNQKHFRTSPFETFTKLLFNKKLDYKKQGCELLQLLIVVSETFTVKKI